MAEPIYLLLGIHHHQPVGNFDSVFEMAFEKCYRPFLDAMERHPSLKFSLHHSGPLLDWAAEREGNYLERVAALVGRGQLEILGGGYYEPILPILKPSDAHGQIEMMQKFWEGRTGVRPSGMWLAERVWEPSLAGLMHDAGMRFTILDDQHFRHAGLTDETLFGHWRTERAGKAVSIFPTDKTMRYLIPFRLVEDVIGHLLHLAQRHPGAAVTYGDDGEKFGVWPGTYDWVIGQGWLEKFLTALEANSGAIKTVTFSEYMAMKPPSGRIYLPTASYSEMLEWAMPAEAIVNYERTRKEIERAGLWEKTSPFFRGGFWDNFMTKYPESNLVHKRALLVSDRIDAAERSGKSLPEARRSLYRAQCNCAYWHGLFGGLYLNYLRHALYKNLIDADVAVDAATTGGGEFTKAQALDFDSDGFDEALLTSRDITAMVSSRSGGALVALDWKPKRFALMNTMARRFEAYHRPAEGHEGNGEGALPSIHDLGKSLGELRRELVYDRFPRYAFVDHAFDSEPDWRGLWENRYEDCADIAGRTFSLESVGGAGASLKALAQTRSGGTLSVEKRYSLSGQSKLSLSYSLKHSGPGSPPPWFATEFNFTMLAGHDKDRYFLWNGVKGDDVFMDAKLVVDDVSILEAVDRAFGFKLVIDAEARKVVLCPVETVSQSEKGFDKIFQGTTAWLAWKPEWSPAGEAQISVGIELKNI